MNSNRRRTTRRLLGAGAVASLLTLGGATEGSAHDFWLEPSSFSPEAASTVLVSLRVGEAFDGRPVRRSAAHIERFVVAGPDGIRPVPGREGLDPAGLAPIDGAGAYLIGYESTASAITLPAGRFEKYLEHEGLDRVLETRRERGESRRPGREVFVRSAKSLVGAAADSSGFDRLLGLPLELVPEVDPGGLEIGEELGLRLLFDGRPIAGVLVRLRSRLRPGDARMGRTDRGGRVRFTLDRQGPWLATAVHMVAADRGDADWKSLWASLTFGGPAAAPAISEPDLPAR